MGRFAARLRDGAGLLAILGLAVAALALAPALFSNAVDWPAGWRMILGAITRWSGGIGAAALVIWAILAGLGAAFGSRQPGDNGSGWAGLVFGDSDEAARESDEPGPPS